MNIKKYLYKNTLKQAFLKKGFSEYFVATSPLALLALLLTPLVPFLVIAFYLQSELKALESLKERATVAHRKQIILKNYSENEEKVFNQLKTADPSFIDKHLETLVFLSEEVEQLETSDLATSDSIYNWLTFLRGEKNRLRFTEEKRRSQGELQETEEKQCYPVQMGENDLKTVLSLIEGWEEDKEGRPQMTIKQLQLTKKRTPTHERVFEVSLDFIKRELHE